MNAATKKGFCIVSLLFEFFPNLGENQYNNETKALYFLLSKI